LFHSKRTHWSGSCLAEFALSKKQPALSVIFADGMKSGYLLILIAEIFQTCAQHPHPDTSDPTMKNTEPYTVKLSEQEWKEKLTPEQYHVLREKGTEPPFSGKYYLHREKGIYVCAGCGNELFTSEMKFDSPCGWPSFDREMEGGRIKRAMDYSHGMIRTEILCARCGSHLGHLFDDGPTETGMRYCVNSLALDFKKDSSEIK
jgi:methionine-R-sulfoxide reductase